MIFCIVESCMLEYLYYEFIFTLLLFFLLLCLSAIFWNALKKACVLMSLANKLT